MTKRGDGTQKKARTPGVSDVKAADPNDSRVVAFAEQLGRIAGTLQGKAEALLDRDALKKQIASVRDGAADLLAQLAGSGATAATEKPAAVEARAKGRSGGVVDAPGKKHRKPPPADPGAAVAHSQAVKMRTAMTMEKTSRRRGRG